MNPIVKALTPSVDLSHSVWSQLSHLAKASGQTPKAFVSTLIRLEFEAHTHDSHLPVIYVGE